MIKQLKDEWNAMSNEVKFYRFMTLVLVIISIAIFEASSPSTIDNQFEQLAQLIGFVMGALFLIMSLVICNHAAIVGKFEELEKQIGELKNENDKN